MGMHHARTSWLVGLTLLACLSAAGMWWVGRAPDRTAVNQRVRTGGSVTQPTSAGRPADPIPSAAPAVAAVEVLREWDQHRAHAYAAGDLRGLRDLYAGRTGTTDVAILRGYLRRGLRVEGMRMQLLAAQVLVAMPTRVRLRVTDRLVGAVAVSSTGRRALPRDAANTRVVELSRESPDHTWQVTSVVRP
jgi:hypothetical protein